MTGLKERFPLLNESYNSLNKNDKVWMVCGENAAGYKGYVDTVTDKYVVIHEYDTNIYSSLDRDQITEIQKI